VTKQGRFSRIVGMFLGLGFGGLVLLLGPFNNGFFPIGPAVAGQSSSTTTTTVPQPGCNSDADCDDDDGCTTDTCTDAGCVHTDATGFDAVSCKLTAIQDLLNSTPPDQRGGDRLGTKLSGRITGAIAKLEAARAADAGSKKQKARLKAVNKLIKNFTNLVQHGLAKGKIDPTVAAQLLDLANGASSGVVPLRS